MSPNQWVAAYWRAVTRLDRGELDGAEAHARPGDLPVARAFDGRSARDTEHPLLLGVVSSLFAADETSAIQRARANCSTRRSARARALLPLPDGTWRAIALAIRNRLRRIRDRRHCIHPTHCCQPERSIRGCRLSN